MKPLPKEPDDERRKKTKVAKGMYLHSSIALYHLSENISYIIYMLHIYIFSIVMDDSRIRNRKSRFFSGNLKKSKSRFFPISAVDFAQC